MSYVFFSYVEPYDQQLRTDPLKNCMKSICTASFFRVGPAKSYVKNNKNIFSLIGYWSKFLNFGRLRTSGKNSLQNVCCFFLQLQLFSQPHKL